MRSVSRLPPARDVERYSNAWHGTVPLCTARRCMAWHGTTWHGVALLAAHQHSLAQHAILLGTAPHSTALHGTACDGHGTAQHSMALPGTARHLAQQNPARHGTTPRPPPALTVFDDGDVDGRCAGDPRRAPFRRHASAHRRHHAPPSRSRVRVPPRHWLEA